MTTAHPWFQPLYRRILTMIACLVLLGFELYRQESLWLTIAVAANVYAVWDFFLSGHYRSQ